MKSEKNKKNKTKHNKTQKKKKFICNQLISIEDDIEEKFKKDFKNSSLGKNFNLETYCDEPTQCMVRCTTTDAWFDLYVYPTLTMLHKVLANDGVYAVNINDYAEYKIVDRWLALSEQCNFRLIDELKMNLNVRPGVGNGKKNNGVKHESVFIFRKKG